MYIFIPFGIFSFHIDERISRSRSNTPGDENAVFGFVGLYPLNKRIGSKKQKQNSLSELEIYPHGTAMVISSVNVLVPYHVIHDNNLTRYGLIREIIVETGISEEEVIELELVEESETEDWSVLKRKDDLHFDKKVVIALEVDLPKARDEVGIRDFPAGLLTVSSTTELKIESTKTKVCGYESRADTEQVPFKAIRVLQKGTKVKPTKLKDVIRVERGRVNGSCGAPYFWKDKVVAFHFESINDNGSGSAESHVSYSLGYVLCRLPQFMKLYNMSNWGSEAI